MAEILSTVSPNGDQGTPANGGGQYTSLSAWQSAQVGDLTGTSNPAGEPSTSVVECYDGDYGNGVGGGQTGRLLFDGWTTDETHYVTIRAAAGSEQNAAGGRIGSDINSSWSGFALIYDTNNSTLRVDSGHLKVQDIGIGGRASSGTSAYTVYGASGGTLWLERCSIDNAQDGRSVIDMRSGSAGYMRNCLVMGLAARTDFRQGFHVYNCTFVPAATATVGLIVRFQTEDGNDKVVKNCVAFAATGDAFDSNGSDALCSNNASSDLTAYGADSVFNVVTTTGVDLVDHANGDYRPAVGGALEGEGIDLSGTFTDDITGATRTLPWEIGAWDIISAGGVTFDGPDIVAQTGTDGVVFSFNENGDGTVASRFTGAVSYALAPTSDALPTGLTVNPTTGNIEGTPTEVATRNIIIEGSD